MGHDKAETLPRPLLELLGHSVTNDTLVEATVGADGSTSDETLSVKYYAQRHSTGGKAPVQETTDKPKEQKKKKKKKKKKTTANEQAQSQPSVEDYISRRLDPVPVDFGGSTVAEAAASIAQSEVGLGGFSPRLAGERFRGKAIDTDQQTLSVFCVFLYYLTYSYTCPPVEYQSIRLNALCASHAEVLSND